MNNLQKMGGVAALYEAAAYIVGMVGFLLVVDVSGVADPVEKVALMADNQAFLSILHLIVYVIWAIFLVVLALALYDRIKARPGGPRPAMAQTATAFALIWAGLVIASGTLFNVGMGTVVELYGQDPVQAATVWMAIEAVFNGLSGLEIVGGTWVLLISWAALRAGELPKALNYLGLAIGLAGILSIVPGVGEIVIIFGLGQIVWFVWLGIVLLRGSSRVAEEQPDTAPVRCLIPIQRRGLLTGRAKRNWRDSHGRESLQTKVSHKDLVQFIRSSV